MMTKQQGLIALAALALVGCGQGSAPAAKKTTPPVADSPKGGPAKITETEKPAAATTEKAAIPAGAPAALGAADSAETPRWPISKIFVLPAAANGSGTLAVEETHKLLDDPKNHERFMPEAPIRLGDVTATIPKENPMTRAKIEHHEDSTPVDAVLYEHNTPLQTRKDSHESQR